DPLEPFEGAANLILRIPRGQLRRDLTGGPARRVVLERDRDRASSALVLELHVAGRLDVAVAGGLPRDLPPGDVLGDTSLPRRGLPGGAGHLPLIRLRSGLRDLGDVLHDVREVGEVAPVRVAALRG